MGRSFGASSLRRALVGLVALKVAGLILVFDHDGIVAFDLPKSLFSRALEWLIAGALVIAILRFGPGIAPRARLHIAVAALIVANLLSTAFAANHYLALFGEQDRYLGLTYLADMVVLYLACAVAVRSIRDWAVVGTAIAIASALTLAYAGLQYAGLDPLSWQDDPRGRPFGT